MRAIDSQRLQAVEHRDPLVGTDYLPRPRGAIDRRPQDEHRVQRRYQEVAVVGHAQTQRSRRLHRAKEVSALLAQVLHMNVTPEERMIGKERGIDSILNRSEERRVGKECRSRWSP